MWRRFMMKAALIIALMLLASPALADKAPPRPDAAAVEKARQEMLAGRDLQTTIPEDDPEPPPEEETNKGKWTIPHAVWWILGGVGGTVLLYFGRDAWRYVKLSRTASVALAVKVVEASPALPPAGIAEADELATRGRFGDAIHILLLYILAKLRQQLPTSLTSREILARAELSNPARDALGVIVTEVELCHFGQREAGPEDYARCRLSYQNLGEALAAS
ncbi:MAG TPA: hypothetical protein VKT70_11215 [Stellaceae bacterium]|nr:hypothetical protein [Stellaceae bacterium]